MIHRTRTRGVGRRSAPEALARVAASIVLVLGVATAAIARDAAFPPPNDGWVTDLAGFLSPQEERALEALMESYRQGSGHEIALLTVPELGGRPLERYALEVGRAWGIGSKETQAGALLLIAEAERAIRIEVGRGLEGTITDSISGRIIRNVIAPELKRGRRYEGVRAGIEAMHAAAGGEYGSIPERRDSRKRGLGALLPLVFVAIVISSIVRRGGRGGGLATWLLLGSLGGRRSSGFGGGGFRGGGGFGGFGGGGGFSGGGASGGW